MHVPLSSGFSWLWDRRDGSTRPVGTGIQPGQNLIGSLSRYHEVMQVSPLAVMKAMSRRADDIYWYSSAEQREWGIVTKR